MNNVDETVQSSTTAPARHWNERYEDQVKSAWFSNDLVLGELNTRIAGHNTFWLTWLLQEQLAMKPKRVLSVGCGDGAHELLIARNGWVEEIDAFDASTSGIQIAQAASDKEQLGIHFYVDTFEGFVASVPTKTYDMVFFIGSLHHVKDIEGMFSRVRACLAPDGLVVVNEYCGPCYNIYEDERVAIINGILAALDPQYKLSPTATWQNSTIESILAVDPSEAVRSALLLDFLRHYFDVRLERPFGGTLLHPLFDHLNSKKLNDSSAESTSIVRLLIEMENTLIKNNVLKNDFMFGVYGHKPVRAR